MKNKVRIPFVVDTKPYCLWDREIWKRNIDFLDMIDPDYFNYLAEVNFNLINNAETDNKKKQHAAILLRNSYSQALEALFALIGATIQAPDCILGWLLKYENKDLKSVIEKINKCETLHTNIQNSPISWTIVADFVFSPYSSSVDELTNANIKKFAELWSYFAKDFLNQNFTDEYNSIKHGLRVYMGGFSVAIDNIKSGYDFGSSYYQQEKIDKYNFVIHEHSRNWHPQSYFYALQLISASMKNIITFLKAYNGGDTTNLQYALLENLEIFDTPWETPVTLVEMKELSTIPVDKIPLLTKDQIMVRYDSKFPI
jgi:hypothetical protein